MKRFSTWMSMLLLVLSLPARCAQIFEDDNDNNRIFRNSVVVAGNTTALEDVDSQEPDFIMDFSTLSSTSSPTSANSSSNSNSNNTSSNLATPTFDVNNPFLGIPGTTQTNNGYDTALGNDPICWVGVAANQYEDVSAAENAAALDISKTLFPNPLVKNFVLLGETEIKKSCPKGNSVKIEKPIESVRGERLRTLRYYNYTLHVEIDLNTLDGDYIFTDNGTATIALQVVTCSLGKSGFCSPFVHEQANVKEAIAKNMSGGTQVANKTKVKGDLHGGTHIHSPWVYMDLGTSRTWNQSVTVPMIVNYPDEYFVIGTVQLYTGVNDTVAYRWDISRALDSFEGRYIRYQAPYVVNDVSDSVLYASYSAIAVASAVILFLIVQTIRHRYQQVLQLSQADFLIVFLFCALVATVFAFLMNPKSDAYCRISYPIIIIPIHIMYAITVGRLWRIHAVISPLLLEHLNKGKTNMTQRLVDALTYISFRLNDLFVKQENRSRRTTAGVKQQISQFQLALVVGLFTLPQVVIQLVAFIFQPQKRVVLFDFDESVGRASCESGVRTAQDLVMYGFFLLVLLVVILLFMAHSSRKLPSLFNETHVIYDSTFLSMVLLCLSAAVIALTSGPETSPDVEYLVSLFLILSITLNSAVRILMPKLRMVWKGDVVVVSKLVTDHHRKAREKEIARSTVMQGVSGFQPSNNFHSSFTRTGDYDPSQENKLLATIHSNSNDTGILGQRSSMEDSDRRLQSPTEAFCDSGISANHEKEDVIGNMLEPDVERAVLVEADLQAGHSGDAEPRASSKDITHQHDPNLANVTCDDTDDNTAMVCDKEDLEAAVAAASRIESGEHTTEKRAPSFEKRAQEFLKQAMAKGLSSFKLAPERILSSEKNVKAADATENDAAMGVSTKNVASRSPKRSANVSKKRLVDRIVVTEDETPARRLVLKMLDLQDQLEEINNKIMSGFAVTQEDWSLVTKLTSRLDRTFKSEVEFEWDIEQRYKESLRDVIPADMSGVHPQQGENNGHITPNRGSNDEFVTEAPPSLANAGLKGILRKTQSHHQTNSSADASNVDPRRVTSFVHRGPAIGPSAPSEHIKGKPLQDDSSVGSFA